MTKWIRWQGLILFAIFSIIIGGFWFFLIDSILERAIEKTGTLLNGAKVELDHADLSIAPAGLILMGVRVTNPDQPMTNSVEIKRLALSLDGLNLILKKVIVEEMSVEGVQFNTPRKTSGAIERQSVTIEDAVRTTVCGDFEFKIPSLEIPDINQILANEDIRTLEIIESLQTDILSEEGLWQTQLNELPDQDDFDEYRKRIENLTSKKGGITGIFSKAGDLKTLHKDIQRDLKSIQNAQKDFAENLESFKERAEQVAKEPLNDIRRLTEKYHLSPQGLENMSQQLLSIKFCEWVQEAVESYDRLKPVIERIKTSRKQREEKEETKGPEVAKPIRAKGADVHFREYDPVPDFHIRVADVSAMLQFGEVAGKLHDITLDQELVGKPLTFVFSGRKLKGLESVELSGELNHTDSSNPEDRINLQVGGFQIEHLTLSENEAIPIILKEGLADIRVNAKLTRDLFDADIFAGFQSIKIETSLMEDADPLMRAILPSLFNIKDLNVAANISGTLENYDINISSDLDKVLKNAVDETVKTQVASFKSELSDALSGKVNEAMGDLDLSLGDFGAIGDELTDRLKEASGLLKPPDGESSLPFGIKLPF